MKRRFILYKYFNNKWSLKELKLNWYYILGDKYDLDKIKIIKKGKNTVLY